jgi:hypothetical protein
MRPTKRRQERRLVASSADVDAGRVLLKLYIGWSEGMGLWFTFHWKTGLGMWRLGEMFGHGG